MEGFLFNEVERQKRIFNNVPAGIEVYDKTGKLIDINIRFIARDEYNNLKNDPILNEIIKNISIKIKDVIDTI